LFSALGTHASCISCLRIQYLYPAAISELGRPFGKNAIIRCSFFFGKLVKRCWPDTDMRAPYWLCESNIQYLTLFSPPIFRFRVLLTFLSVTGCCHSTQAAKYIMSMPKYPRKDFRAVFPTAGAEGVMVVSTAEGDKCKDETVHRQSDMQFTESLRGALGTRSYVN
jgi:hypothetical protein